MFSLSSLLLTCLLPVLVLRSVRATPEAGPWSWRVDLPLALAIGIGTVLLRGTEIPASHLENAPYIITDSMRVCAIVDQIRTGPLETMHRFPGGLIFAALMAKQMPMIEAIFRLAFLSATAHTALLYVAGRLIHSRAAGVAAAVLAGAIGPLVLIQVHPTFHPPAAAGFLACTVGGIVALRTRGWRAGLAAGLGAGIGLVVDYGGIAFAAVVLVVGAVRAVSRRPAASLVALFALTAPLVASWGFARAYTPPDIRSFEQEVFNYMKDSLAVVPEWVVRDADPWRKFVDLPTHPAPAPPGFVLDLLPAPHQVAMGEGYRPGYSGPFDAARALLTVSQLTLGYVPEDAPFEDGENLFAEREVHIAPWLGALVVAVPIALLGLRRRPWLLVGTVLLIAPYASGLSVQYGTRALPRFIMASFTFVPLVLGLALATVALRPDKGTPRPRRSGLVALLLGGLLLAQVQGWWQTDLSPRAEWREPFPSVSGELSNAIQFLVNGPHANNSSDAPYRDCLKVLREDRDKYGEGRAYALPPD